MFQKMMLVVGVAFCISSADATTQDVAPSKSIVVETKSGDLTLKDLIEACSKIAQSVSSKRANKDMVGDIISIHNKNYEIRFFSFEDTSGKLPKDMTFQQYVIERALLDAKSIAMDPLPGIHFESFDYRRSDLKDGVYFSMAVRPINGKKPSTNTEKI
ncbi:MAG: hypothetical protein ACRYGR_07055 [Janthinobacterium lividum]